MVTFVHGCMGQDLFVLNYRPLLGEPLRSHQEVSSCTYIYIYKCVCMYVWKKQPFIVLYSVFIYIYIYTYVYTYIYCNLIYIYMCVICIHMYQTPIKCGLKWG